MTANSYPFTILEGDKLVIPQKPLYAAYLHAAKALAKLPRTSTAGQTLEPSDGSWRSIDRISKVIVLQNPEHTQALNLRKRAIHASASREAVEAELHFTALILGIPANAKMSSLWHQRRWLLSLLYGTAEHGIPSATSSARHIFRMKADINLPQDVLEREIALVAQAAKLYPRNYQAWAYRGWLLKCQEASALAGTEERRLAEAYVAKELTLLTSHLRLNATDHTAMVYVTDLLQSSLATAQDWKRMQKVGLDLAGRYPHREMPWLFIRFFSQHSGPAGNEAFWEETERLIMGIVDVETQDKAKQADWAQQETERAVRFARRSQLFVAYAFRGSMRGLGDVRARRLLESTRV